MTPNKLSNLRMAKKVTNKDHLNFLKELKRYAGKGNQGENKWVKKYLGTKKLYYGVSAPIKKKIIKEWIKERQAISIKEYIELLNSLYSGESFEERAIAGKLLEFLSALRKQLNPLLLKKWLNEAEGWSEVDSICQSSFSAAEIFSKWNIWKKMIIEFSTDKNIHKKRASLVLLTKPIRESRDPRLLKLAFQNIEKLKAEKDILITKAISWLLRDSIKNHKKEIKEYLEKNKDSLPKIAVRETTRKLLTGKK